MTPQQFEDIYDNLPNDAARLLIEVDIESGLRWGELTELRPKDIDFTTRVLTVRRVAVELVPRFHPEGGRFLVKQYPKDREHRRLKLGAEIISKINEHVSARGIGDDDLLFPISDFRPLLTTREVEGSREAGFTDANATGRRYPHRKHQRILDGQPPMRPLQRRLRDLPGATPRGGKGQPPQPTKRRHDGHLPRRWFREHIWLQAIKRADLKIPVRPTTSGTRTPPGCSPVARTFRWSRNVSVTARSPPPRNTCTPSPMLTKPPWTLCPRSVRPVT